MFYFCELLLLMAWVSPQLLHILVVFSTHLFEAGSALRRVAPFPFHGPVQGRAPSEIDQPEPRVFPGAPRRGPRQWALLGEDVPGVHGPVCETGFVQAHQVGFHAPARTSARISGGNHTSPDCDQKGCGESAWSYRDVATSSSTRMGFPQSSVSRIGLSRRSCCPAAGGTQ